MHLHHKLAWLLSYLYEFIVRRLTHNISYRFLVIHISTKQLLPGPACSSDAVEPCHAQAKVTVSLCVQSRQIVADPVNLNLFELRHTIVLSFIEDTMKNINRETVNISA